MKILQINPFKINSNNTTELNGTKNTAPFFGVKLKPQLQHDTVSFSAKPPSIMAPTMEDLINRTKASDILRLNILRLAKYDVPCPVCGRIMLDLDKYNEFEGKILKTKDPHEILNYIEGLKKYLHPIEKQIFEMMKADNLKNPKMTLHDMLKIRLPESESKIVALQSQILGNIGIYSHNLSGEERINVLNLINETFARIIDPRETSRFSRKIFLKKLKNIFIPEHLRTNLRLKFITEFQSMYKGTEYYTQENLAEYVDNKLSNAIQNWIYTPEQDKIIEEAVKLPKAYNNVDAFIVKYAKRDYKRANPDQKIALRMLSNSLATVEHIKPQAKRGETKPSNLALECACCNNGRNDDSLIEQISENPIMPVNYRRYMKKLCQLHHDNIVEKSYITQQNKTFKEESYGYLDVNLTPLLSKENKERSRLIRSKLGRTPTKAERRAARKMKLVQKKSKKSKYNLRKGN